MTTTFRIRFYCCVAFFTKEATMGPTLGDRSLLKVRQHSPLCSILLTSLLVALAFTSLSEISFAAVEVPQEGEFRLTKSAESGVEALVQTSKECEGMALMASINKDGVLVTARKGETVVLGVTLKHPNQGADNDIAIRNFVVHAQPGPSDKAALNALLKRLRQNTSLLPWETPPAARKTLPKEALFKARETLELANYKIVIGQKDAGIALLNSLPSQLPPGMLIDAAIAFRSVGMTSKMKALLGRDMLKRQNRMAADLLLGKDRDVTSTVNELSRDNACDSLSLMEVLHTLEKYESLLALATAIRKADPECAGAWDVEFNEYTRRKELPHALKVAEEAYHSRPKDRLARLRYGGAMQRLEDFAGAAATYEAIARDFPKEQGILRLTLGVMLRDVAGRDAHKKRLSERLKKDPTDIVSQFLRGVLHHYENEFEASNRLLRPLEQRLKHEQRIDIYLAMNDFNQGRKDDAMRRLNEAANAPIPDPDVFYCRAEILRDERREQAISDLERYLATSERSLVSNAGKQIRVKKLRDDLKRCLKDGTPKCQSEWEHPRHLLEKKAPNSEVRTEEERNYWPYAGLLILVIGAFFVWRKRSEA
jgi:hypothetical protein